MHFKHYEFMIHRNITGMENILNNRLVTSGPLRNNSPPPPPVAAPQATATTAAAQTPPLSCFLNVAAAGSYRRVVVAAPCRQTVSGETPLGGIGSRLGRLGATMELAGAGKPEGGVRGTVAGLMRRTGGFPGDVAWRARVYGHFSMA